MGLLGGLFGQRRKGQVLGDVTIKFYDNNDTASITVSPSLLVPATGVQSTVEWSWLYLIHLANTFYYLDGFDHSLAPRFAQTVKSFLHDLAGALVKTTLLKTLPRPLSDETMIVPVQPGGRKFTYSVVRAPDGMPIILSDVPADAQVGQLALANLVFLDHVIGLIRADTPTIPGDETGTPSLIVGSLIMKGNLLNLILSPVTALVKYYEETPGAYGDMSSTIRGPLYAFQPTKSKN